jgi:SAM-dependent methyltransferase
VTRASLLRGVEVYYSEKVTEHGPTPRGVDWNGVESQTLRFTQLLRVYDGREPFSLIDYGCGYGGIVPFVNALGAVERYVGVDLSSAMLEHARATYAADGRISFVDSDRDLAPADFTVASGVFNVKLDASADEWRGYVLETIDRLAELGTAGFAFNMLTSYSDPDRMRDDLYYGDPGFFFDYCKRRHAPHVALLHDYGLYEFTLIARRELRA